ncbi:hypothetical protein F7734_19740 [Scytonema sp. UIC 10036]|nr:hypothetical protein [Scytonema sp. UIC 10036]
MMLQGLLQISLMLLIVVLLTPVIGGYLAQIFIAKRIFLDPVMEPIEHFIYQLYSVETEQT